MIKLKDNQKKKRRSMTATDKEWKEYEKRARAAGCKVSEWINRTLKTAIQEKD